jgi:hypothetical protein
MHSVHQSSFTIIEVKYPEWCVFRLDAAPTLNIANMISTISRPAFPIVITSASSEEADKFFGYEFGVVFTNANNMAKLGPMTFVATSVKSVKSAVTLAQRIGQPHQS